MGALDVVAVRELRRYRLRAGATVVAGCVLLAGFVFAVKLVEGRAEKLERSGRRVPAVVTKVSSRLIEVRYAWHGVPQTGLVRLDDSSPEYQVDQEVTALVDRNDPNHFSIRGEVNQSPVTVWLMIFALVGGAAATLFGGASLVRAGRQRRALARFGWRRVEVVYKELRGLLSVQPVLLLRYVLEKSPQPLVTLVPIARWRLSRLGFRGTHEVDIAGDPTRYAVVRAPGNPHMASARPPMTRRAERRWRHAFWPIGDSW